MKNQHKAFTLVELIVVITILAILGTIAFLAFQGYSKTARDSRRVSDINNIKTALELFILNTGKYPLPDNGEEVSYSGDTLWTQGTIGDNVITNLSETLKTKPLDPLLDIEYVYSATYSQKEYQVMALYEGELSQTNNLINTSYAVNNYNIKLEGTYNEIFVKSQRFIVPTPSIINSEVNGAELILGTGTILSQVTTGGINFPKLNIPNVTVETGSLDGIVFSATGTIDKDSSYAQKVSVINAIQATYTGATSLVSKSTYKNILNTTEPEILADQLILNKYNTTSTIITSGGYWMMTIGSTVGDNNLVLTNAQLNSPHGMTTDSAGNIYIADTYNEKIKKYDSSGNWLMTIGGTQGDNNLDGTSATFYYPFNVEVDSSGNIYVADYGNSKIKKYDSTGKWLMTIGGGRGNNDLSGINALMSVIMDLAVDSSGNIYVTDFFNEKIKKYDSSGNFLFNIGSIRGDNNLNASNAQLFHPEGVDVDSLGNVYIADTYNNKIKKYDNSGNFIMAFGSSYGDNKLSGADAQFTPSGVVVDPLGNIIVTNTYFNKIKKYDSSGNWLMDIGSGTQGDNNENASTAQMYYPFSAGVDSEGNIYIIDNMNNKMKKYSH